MTDREKAKREYLGGKSLKKIAEELGLKDSTIRSWKLRDGWPKVQRKRATKKQSVAALQKEKKEPPIIQGKLNDKQQLFCELYVREFNAPQAYMTAYNCEYNTAASQGYKLLKTADVRTYVESLKALKKESIMVNIDDIVDKMMKIAFNNMGNYISFGRRDVQVMTQFGPLYTKDDGKGGGGDPVMKTVNYIDAKDSRMVDTSLIAEMSQGKEGIKIKILDPMKALEWLGKFFNAFPLDKHRIEYDSKKQELDRLEYERKKKHDESEDF